MSLRYGLNIKKKTPVPARKTILDEDDEHDEEPPESRSTGRVQHIASLGNDDSHNQTESKVPALNIPLPSMPPPRKSDIPDRQNLSSLHASRTYLRQAQDIDPSILDYDAFHDAKSTVLEKKRQAEDADKLARKPKYMQPLLDAAAQRKQTSQIALEKKLQREREAEGDEFADKERFVTDAYKTQQEETRRLAAEEKRKADEDERRKRAAGGGMQAFYRDVIDQVDRQHQLTVDATEQAEKTGLDSSQVAHTGEKTEAQIAEELRVRGVAVHVNDEGQLTDKRQLLSAGLNVGSSRADGSALAKADHLRVGGLSTAHAGSARRNGAPSQATRERQSRMLEEQLALRTKRAREEEAQEREKLEKEAKSKKTAGEVGDAKARFLARKAARERGEG